MIARIASFFHRRSSGTVAFSDLTGKPTTLSGYGITDAAASSHTHAFASLTSKPTTTAGYGITDAAKTVLILEGAMEVPSSEEYLLVLGSVTLDPGGIHDGAGYITMPRTGRVLISLTLELDQSVPDQADWHAWLEADSTKVRTFTRGVTMKVQTFTLPVLPVENGTVLTVKVEHFSGEPKELLAVLSIAYID